MHLARNVLIFNVGNRKESDGHGRGQGDPVEERG